MSNIRYNQGFTLIEVMAALAVLGTAMFMLLQAHYGAMRLFDTARDEVQVSHLLSRAMGIAETEIATGEANGNGDFGERYPDHTYQFETETASDDMPGLMRVRVEVEGPDKAHEVVFYMYYQGQ